MKKYLPIIALFATALSSHSAMAVKTNLDTGLDPTNYPRVRTIETPFEYLKLQAETPRAFLQQGFYMAGNLNDHPDLVIVSGPFAPCLALVVAHEESGAFMFAHISDHNIVQNKLRNMILQEFNGINTSELIARIFTTNCDSEIEWQERTSAAYTSQMDFIIKTKSELTGAGVAANNIYATRNKQKSIRINGLHSGTARELALELRDMFTDTTKNDGSKIRSINFKNIGIYSEDVLRVNNMPFETKTYFIHKKTEDKEKVLALIKKSALPKTIALTEIQKTLIPMQITEKTIMDYIYIKNIQTILTEKNIQTILTEIQKTFIPIQITEKTIMDYIYIKNIQTIRYYCKRIYKKAASPEGKSIDELELLVTNPEKFYENLNLYLVKQDIETIKPLPKEKLNKITSIELSKKLL